MINITCSDVHSLAHDIAGEWSSNSELRTACFVIMVQTFCFLFVMLIIKC